MEQKAQSLLLATKTTDGYHPESILPRDDPFSSLEYGDVAEGEYQVWEYPTGNIYTLQVDREVDEDKYYSLPYSTSGQVWAPVLKLVTSDADFVKAAYERFAQSN